MPLKNKKKLFKKTHTKRKKKIVCVFLNLKKNPRFPRCFVCSLPSFRAFPSHFYWGNGVMLSLLGFKSRFLAILMIFTYNLAFKENKRLIIEKKT